MTATCLKGCGREWTRDPVLEVECPECHAAVGVQCKRPSGHRLWGGEPHAARDILADQQGCYGSCPRQLCGVENVARRGDADTLPAPLDQLSLF